MEENQFVGCISITDSKGKVVHVYEIKTLLKSQYADLVKQARENLKANVEEEIKKEQAKKEEEKKLIERLDKFSIMLAYSMFNELVERGKASTTKEFEEMFSDWLKGEKEITKENCPKDYLDILERLGA